MSRADRDRVMAFIRRVVPWEAPQLPRWRFPQPGFVHIGSDGGRHVGKNTQWYQRWESIIRLDYARKARGDERPWQPALERFNIAQATEPWRDALRRLQRHAFPGSERFPNWYDPAQRHDARNWGVLTVRLDAMLEVLGEAAVKAVLRGFECERCEPRAALENIIRIGERTGSDQSHQADALLYALRAQLGSDDEWALRYVDRSGAARQSRSGSLVPTLQVPLPTSLSDCSPTEPLEFETLVPGRVDYARRIAYYHRQNEPALTPDEWERRDFERARSAARERSDAERHYQAISSGRRFGKNLELDQVIREHLREGRTVAVATPDGTVDGEGYLQSRERTDP